jgi:hypothetical protein
LVRWLQLFRLKKEIDVMRIRRGKVEFGARDTYDFSALSQVIHDWLVKFKEQTEERGGVPIAFLPEGYTGQSDDGEKKLEEGNAKWMEALDEMIFAFSGYEPEIDFNFIPAEGHGETQEVGGSTYYSWYMVADDPEKSKAYDEAVAQTNERKKKGRELFAKHFEALWW